MGNFNISAVLKKAGERQWDDRTLVQESTELAATLLNDSARKLSSDERSLLSALNKVAEDAKNKDFLLNLCNRVLHSNRAITSRSFLPTSAAFPLSFRA